MKLTKSDVTLNEKDALTDMLESEKQLMSLYTTALFEGSTKSIRKNFSENLYGVAENQFSLYTQLSTRGYYQPKQANKADVDEINATYKKEKKNLKNKTV